MTDAAALDAPPLPTPPPLPLGPPPLPGLVSFVGTEAAYWRLRIKGAALLLVTLGIYRFWLLTDVRRFLWSNTEIAGETLEYDGLATELLVGFLFAIAILVPIYVAIAMATLAFEWPDYASALGGLVLFAVFGEFARYRARRYRLTRTVFRGLRFHQDGSGWLYALYAILWWILIIVSLGLAYPWAQANLQRYMMRHTSYGKLPGRFEGAGWRLFLRGLPLWLAAVGPVLVAAGFVARADRLARARCHRFARGGRRRIRRHRRRFGRPGSESRRSRPSASAAWAAAFWPPFCSIRCFRRSSIAGGSRACALAVSPSPRGCASAKSI